MIQFMKERELNIFNNGGMERFVDFIFFITVNGQTVRVQRPVALRGFVY